MKNKMQNMLLSISKRKALKKLLDFYKDIANIFDELNLNPIVYGSLAYYYHTRDNSISIHDFDLLIKESSFPKIVKLLDKQRGIRYKVMPYHSIEIFKDELKIDIDSLEYFLPKKSKATNEFSLKNVTFNIINKNSLIWIYQDALKNMPADRKLDKRITDYQKKLKKLKTSALR
jgi:hypothetical protein